MSCKSEINDCTGFQAYHEFDIIHVYCLYVTLTNVMGVVVPSMSSRKALVFSGTEIAAIFINGKRYWCYFKSLVFYLIVSDEYNNSIEASGELTHGASLL